MRAESFYAFGAALGLSQDGMEALLNGGEPPQVEASGDGFVQVMIPSRYANSGLEGVATRVKAKTMDKWIKELNRLRDGKPR
jgi:hypothetical protein